MAMSLGERVGHRDSDAHRLLESGASLQQPLAQVLALEVFESHVGPSEMLADGVHRDDVRVAELRGRAHLEHEPLNRVRTDNVGPHDLQRHPTAEIDGPSQVHFAHPALGQELQHLELVDVCPRRQCHPFAGNGSFGAARRRVGVESTAVVGGHYRRLSHSAPRGWIVMQRSRAYASTQRRSHWAGYLFEHQELELFRHRVVREYLARGDLEHPSGEAQATSFEALGHEWNLAETLELKEHILLCGCSQPCLAVELGISRLDDLFDAPRLIEPEPNVLELRQTLRLEDGLHRATAGMPTQDHVTYLEELDRILNGGHDAAGVRRAVTRHHVADITDDEQLPGRSAGDELGNHP
jgi:hypothetical protein